MRGQPQPLLAENEEMLDFDFSDFPQLPPPLVALTLDDRVSRLEETLAREF